MNWWIILWCIAKLWTKNQPKAKS